MSFYCKKCGNLLPDNAKFCDKCGAKVTSPDTQTVISKGDSPINYGRKSSNPNLIGFSQMCFSPEIQDFKAKKKNNMGCIWFFCFVPLIGLILMTVTGLFTGDSDGESILFALLFGGIITGILLIIALIIKANKHKEKPGWEGTVIEKTKKEERDYHAERHSSDNHNKYYTNYTIYVRTDDGQNKQFGEINSNDLYSYFKVGDRVRYHPVLEYYEKYDKSRDNYIFCACCKKRNPIENERCKFCGKPLFK